MVCEQEVFNTSISALPNKNSEPCLRFQSEEERAAHKAGISRRAHARLINANFRPGDLYVTLTFDKQNECHSYEECWMLLRRYIKRLRNKYPHAKIAYYCGRGENTNRYHAHMLACGIPEEFLISNWGYGEVREISRLRSHNIYEGIDHGADYTALANYLFDHWEPEQGPHRYHHTRNFDKPEVEEYTECKRKYSADHPPRAPKGYRLVEVKTTRYGYMYFKYVKEPRKPFLDFEADPQRTKKTRKRRTRHKQEPEEFN